ncbi:HNH endonuclease signature motif containing protein, partial [Microbacterium sp. 18062]|uniref:HNH endonuclease signature motif containing protein n=1 Tax=Microbacterium sp. 18062 TaxID=2681410 RepID=UPI00135C37F0
ATPTSPHTPTITDDAPSSTNALPDDDRQIVITGPHPKRPPGTNPPDPAADTRTIGQRRADILAELLLTASPQTYGDGLEHVTGRIQVTVPALTLAGIGIGTEPAHLAGYGPIDPSFARRLAANAPGWDRVFTDPYTGLPLAVDRYRPNKQLIRYLHARDERCRTPTCTIPAHRCDLDHTIDAANGGPTDEHNLADFCRRHHVGKHGTAWTVTQHPGGVLHWTSPTGRTYTDRPPATIRFVPHDDTPPPF